MNNQEQQPSTRQARSQNMKFGRYSYFDGGLFELILLSLGGFIMTVFTIGILYPWALCLVYGWKINHTVIEGHRMHFNGTGLELFGNWIKWLLLSIITIGIYSFWVNIKLEDWKAKHTTFVNQLIVITIKRLVQQLLKAAVTLVFFIVF